MGSERERVINEQIKNGTYISEHLKSGAVDIRSRDMTAKEKEELKKAANREAKSVILETTPPQFCLQF